MPGNNGKGGDMKQIKTSELQGQQLVDKVAEAQGWELYESYYSAASLFWMKQDGTTEDIDYNPLANTQAGKAQAMEILDKMEDIYFHEAAVVYYPSNLPRRAIIMSNGSRRENLLRCFVASKLGDTVTVEGE